MLEARIIRGHSSVGRAFEWHSKGRRFDSAWLHQEIYQRKQYIPCPGFTIPSKLARLPSGNFSLHYIKANIYKTYQQFYKGKYNE
jgi:hypothetical protein